jgi:hypothetical protein
MATLEHEELLPGGREQARDRHVFVSRGERRQRLLGAAGVVAGGLALVWLLALGVAVAGGSTQLPGLPAPTTGHATVKASALGSTAPPPALPAVHAAPVARLALRAAGRSTGATATSTTHGNWHGKG